MIIKFEIFNEAKKTLLNDSVIKDLIKIINKPSSWDDVINHIYINRHSVNIVDVFKVLIDLKQEDVIKGIIDDEGFEEDDTRGEDIRDKISDENTFEIMWYAFTKKEYYVITTFTDKETSINLTIYALADDKFWPIIKWYQNKIKPLKFDWNSFNFLNYTFLEHGSNPPIAKNNFIKLLKEGAKITTDILTDILIKDLRDVVFKIIEENFEGTDIVKIIDDDAWYLIVSDAPNYAPQWFIDKYDYLFEINQYTNEY